MNKTVVSIFIASGLLVTDMPDAAAHDEFRTEYRQSPHYRYETQHRDRRHAMPVRAAKMPRWLKEDRSFRHWYKHTRLQRNPFLSWHELFDIYRWEHSRDRHRRSHYRYRH